MKTNKIIISLTTVIALTTTSYAGGKYIVPAVAPIVPIPAVINPTPLYVGLGLITAGLSRDCPCGDGTRLKDTTYGGLIRVGWDITDYIGIEARGLKASLEKDFSETTHYGLFLKPQYHLSDAVNVYGLIGYGKTTVDYTCGGNSSELTKNGVSYGAGLEYDLFSDESLGQYSRIFDGQGDQEKGWGLWVDFQHLLYNEGVFNTDSNIVSAGITYDF